MENLSREKQKDPMRNLSGLLQNSELFEIEVGGWFGMWKQ